MSTIQITVPVTIVTDDKYCDEWCMQLRGERETISYTAMRRLVLGPYRCALFDTPIQRCLGGGPLRCGGCLEAEQKIVYTPRRQEQKVNAEVPAWLIEALEAFVKSNTHLDVECPSYDPVEASRDAENGCAAEVAAILARCKAKGEL